MLQVLLEHCHTPSFTIVQGCSHTTAKLSCDGLYIPQCLQYLLSTFYKRSRLYALSPGSVHSGDFNYRLHTDDSQSNIFRPRSNVRWPDMNVQPPVIPNNQARNWESLTHLPFPTPTSTLIIKPFKTKPKSTSRLHPYCLPPLPNAAAPSSKARPFKT